MEDIKNNDTQSSYWSNRYKNAQIGWDIGTPSRPLVEYINQLNNKNLKILIPGAGNGYEAEYLFAKGFKNVYILDIAEEPLLAFKKRVQNFPDDQIIQANFFERTETYDLIFEQTFFCSFVPTEKNRKLYVKHMSDILKTNGKLVGLWFDIPLTGNMEKRPFGGDRAIYLAYLSQYFETIVFENCYNSIPPRAGNELFGIFRKKQS